MRISKVKSYLNNANKFSQLNEVKRCVYPQRQGETDTNNKYDIDDWVIP